MQQSLRDRLQSMENAVLKLDRLETAWCKVEFDLRSVLRELESAYQVVVARVLARAGSPSASLADASTRRHANRAAQR
jgi:hypothetical protein